MRATDTDVRALERHYRGHHNTCGASNGSCFHPACRCPCHQWAREVLAYVGAQRLREQQARQAPAIVINMGPTPQPERDMQDAARRAAYERQLRG